MDDAVGNNDHKWAPVVIFAYNRPAKLAAMLESLQACHGFQESPVKIFVDGPKASPDRDLVDAVHTVVRSIRHPDLSYTFSDVNRGLRESIFAGVTEVIHTHGRAIVLEDDLVLSPIALQYFNDGLVRYRECDRVWSIVGYLYDAAELRGRSETVALPFTHPWGWATWARAWRHFDLNSRPTPADLGASSFKSAFDMGGLYPFTAQLKNSIEGRVNSWFIHWYYTVFRNGGLSIFPPRRVLDNFGLRDGSHGGALNPYDRLVTRPPLLDELPEFGDSAEADFAALDALRHCRELRVQRFIAQAGSAKRTLKSMR